MAIKDACLPLSLLRSALSKGSGSGALRPVLSEGAGIARLRPALPERTGISALRTELAGRIETAALRPALPERAGIYALLPRRSGRIRSLSGRLLFTILIVPGVIHRTRTEAFALFFDSSAFVDYLLDPGSRFFLLVHVHRSFSQMLLIPISIC
jgi:hypothetical protein